MNCNQSQLQENYDTKINKVKLNNCQIKLFLLKTSEVKTIKISVLHGLPVEKPNILLECLLCYIIPKRYEQ